MFSYFPITGFKAAVRASPGDIDTTVPLPEKSLTCFQVRARINEIQVVSESRRYERS